MTKRLTDLEHYDRVRDGWLLDTNIISFLVSKKPMPPAVEHFFQAIDDARFRISAITIGELSKGMQLLTEDRLPLESVLASRQHALALRLTELQTVWADRILPVDLAVANTWGNMLAHYQRAGQPVPPIDALIAATASVHNLVVVTRDAAFRNMLHHVSVYDPWVDV
jgi:predicted nucleic acid-binding protein